MSEISRRSVLQSSLAFGMTAALSPFLSFAQAAPKGKKVLFFTRSQDFPHSMVTRNAAGDLGPAEKIMQSLAATAGYELTISKDGTVFTPDNIASYDAFIFYTTGIETDPPGTKYKSDQTPAMTPAGKKAFLEAIAAGKGFLGVHSASDTFHSPKHDVILRPEKPPVDPADPNYIDPYIQMIGGEFNAHGSQQKSTIRAVSTAFPGLGDLKDFDMTEEWYSLYNLAPDLHVLLIQDTVAMKTDANGDREPQYRRGPYPETWARMHENGRVFYTSMGHREDVWTNPLYQKILLAALAWTTRGVNADLPPNFQKVCPSLFAKPA